MTRTSLRWLIPLTMFVSAVVSCGGCFLWPGGAIPSKTRKILEQADEWELYSLFPDENEKSLPSRFQGWPILGKTTVRDAKTLRHLFEALADGTSVFQQLLPALNCFSPRHGIHARYDGESVDLVICFECGYVYQNGMTDQFRTKVTPQQAFDTVLADAGLLLAPSGPPPWKVPIVPNESEERSRSRLETKRAERGAAADRPRE